MGIRSWIGSVVIVVICALLLVADATVYRPRREKLKELTRELAIAETEHAYVAGHSTYFERILDFLPEEVGGMNEGEQQFLSKISEELQGAGMGLTRVEPRRVVEDGSYTRRTFKLEIEGGYRQFANFLRYLELLPEVVIVNSFELRSKQLRQGSKHAAMLTVTVIGH
ncbi:MAG: type 4a pilus biogenesis protein PilO [Candidatus Eisenbacteria sp.]|nr:type 4a pilus biogenesis protein PilO [Candidatus Eisenbacteria bacterium]